jgi:hypothetical protein
MCSLFASFPSFDFCEDMSGSNGVICYGIQIALGPIGLLFDLIFGPLGKELSKGIVSLIEKAANVEVGALHLLEQQLAVSMHVFACSTLTAPSCRHVPIEGHACKTPDSQLPATSGGAVGLLQWPKVLLAVDFNPDDFKLKWNWTASYDTIRDTIVSNHQGVVVSVAYLPTFHRVETHWLFVKVVHIVRNCST